MSSLCPQPLAGTQIKKRKHGLNGGTRIGLFTDIIFDIIELMSFGFWSGFSWICKCWNTSFPSGISVDTLHIDNSPYLASPVGEGQIQLAVLLLVCSRLIVSDLSTTRATSINLSLTEPE